MKEANKPQPFLVLDLKNIVSPNILFLNTLFLKHTNIQIHLLPQHWPLVSQKFMVEYAGKNHLEDA